MTGLWIITWWVGGALGVAALVVCVLALFRDRSRGRRRCPRCWYDMSGTAGATCPECGRTQRKERAFFHTRRHWRGVGAAGVMLFAALALAASPAIYSGDWAKYTPTPVLRAALSLFETQADRVLGKVNAGTPAATLSPIDQILLAGALSRAMRHEIANPSVPEFDWIFGGRSPSPTFATYANTLTLIGEAGKVAYPELALGLTHPQFHIRRTSLETHALIGPQARDNIPAIRRLLADDSFASHREDAIEALMRMDASDARTANALHDIASTDDDAILRLQAVAALVALAPEREVTVRALERVIAAPDPRAAIAAARMLGWLAHSTDSTALPTFDRTRCLSLMSYAPGRYPSPAPIAAAPAALSKGLTHADPRVRQRTADTLAGIGARVTPFAPLLRLRIDTELDPRARAAAINAFVRAENQSFLFLVPEITEVLQTGDPDASAWAAWILGQCGADAASSTPQLKDAALGATAPWHGVYCEALVGVGPGGVAVLADFIRRPDPLGLAAAHALGRHASARGGTAILLAASRDDSPDARLRAAEGLRHLLHASPVRERLIQLARSDTDPRVRRAAINGLALEPTSALIGLCVDALHDPDEDVSREAVQILGAAAATSGAALRAIRDATKDPREVIAQHARARLTAVLRAQAEAEAAGE